MYRGIGRMDEGIGKATVNEVTKGAWSEIPSIYKALGGVTSIASPFNWDKIHGGRVVYVRYNLDDDSDDVENLDDTLTADSEVLRCLPQGGIATNAHHEGDLVTTPQTIGLA